MLPREQEQALRAWEQRRESEIRSMHGVQPLVEPGAGKSISDDGKCLVCRGELALVTHQPHLSRDWAWCRFCGNTMPVVEGVLQC